MGSLYFWIPTCKDSSPFTPYCNSQFHTHKRMYINEIYKKPAGIENYTRKTTILITTYFRLMQLDCFRPINLGHVDWNL